MRSSSRRTTMSWAGAVALALVVATLLPSPHAAAQTLTDARRARIARSLALSTVSIECMGSRASGFVIGSERWILSTFHVVESASHARGQRGPITITVIFSSGTRRQARLLAAEPGHDLALLEIDGGHVPAPPLTLADSDPVAAGQHVLAYGTPLGETGALTEGVVTGRADLDMDTAPLARQLIQTDASIRPGVSGGPLVDRAGRVIGVSWAGYLDEALQCLAIPANYARDLLARARAPAGSQLRQAPTTTPSATPPAILSAGLGVVDVGALRGVRVVHVVPVSPAARAGIVGGDEPFDDAAAPWVGPIITAADLHPIGSVVELEAYLATCAPGQVVQLSLRAGIEPSARTGEVSLVLDAVP